MDAHHNMGYALEVQGRYAEAIEFYENAIKLAPNLFPLYIDAGRTYHIGLGDYEIAAERYKRAIKLNPFDPEGYDLLGWAYYFNGEYARAIDALEQSLSLDPAYVNPYRRESAWGHLGTIYYTRQNYEKAIEYLPKAIEVGENEFIRRARRVEIHTEVETLTGPQSIPLLTGRFARLDNLNYVAELQPVTYVADVEFDSEQSCGEAISQSIKNKKVLPGSTQVLSFTQVFSRTGGTARLDPASDSLFLELDNLPQSNTTPYEIQVTFWPNRTDSVGNFQPDGSQRARVNIQFEEKLPAPIEYYYTLGLAYTYLGLCEQAVPWLLRSLEIDSSPYSPAWAGLRDCPSDKSPPTPIPTLTPLPEAEQ
jgi:tetratricopeptide (TPR) repeat protein